jgi:hypothetical protein
MRIKQQFLRVTPPDSTTNTGNRWKYTGPAVWVVKTGKLDSPISRSVVGPSVTVETLKRAVTG